MHVYVWEGRGGVHNSQIVEYDMHMTYVCHLHTTQPLSTTHHYTAQDSQNRRLSFCIHITPWLGHPPLQNKQYKNILLILTKEIWLSAFNK